MKIVLIGPVPPYRGGIAHFTLALAENLTSEGHMVRTISYRTQYPKWLYPGKSDKDLSQKNTLEDVEFLFSPLNFLDWRRTFNEIKDFQPDLVIYPWWVTFWAPATAWLLGKLHKSGIPTKVLVHNAFPHEEKWIDRNLTKFALKDARDFVTLAENQTKRLRSVVNKNSTIETAAHPVYAQFPLSGLGKVKVRKKLKLPEKKPIALFFGFVRPYKGLGVLLEAIAILKQEHIDLHLVVAGEFWQGQADYQKQINELQISDMVTIRANYIPDSEAGLYFEAADLFVAPYLDGTQSGSIKAAMSYGLPLIVSNVIVDPMIRRYNCGIEIILAGDVAGLAESIRNSLAAHEITKPEGFQPQNSWTDLISMLITGQNLHGDL